MKHPRPTTQRGFTYAEVILATLLVAITLVPALEALTGGLKGLEVSRSAAQLSLRAASHMESVLSLDWSTLDAAANAAGSASTPSSLSDSSGITDRRIVYLSYYDGDNADSDDDPFSGVESSLIWVRVEIENAGHGLESLVTQ